MTNDRTVRFSEYGGKGYTEAIEVLSLKDGFVLKSYAEGRLVGEVLATPEELNGLYSLLGSLLDK